jgi:solute carrier family 34 (sodium-dependent phosphate cotransporter)
MSVTELHDANPADYPRPLSGPVRFEPGSAALAAPELPLAAPEATARRRWALRQRVHVGKITLFLASLYLFILAIALMKEGARGIAPLVRSLLAVDSPANALGFGWLFAYTIMSGSPVAAAALTFFDVGIVDKLGAFAMITGSRLGGSFIVLFLGFLYVVRGRDRATSLSMGLLSLMVTGTTYLPGLALGALLLHTGLVDGMQLQSGAVLTSAMEAVVEPVTGAVISLLPEWAAFAIGLGVILTSFHLFDRCLPQMTLKESQFGWMSRLVYRPWVMFLLGALITMISMSVSLSLSILVPLSARGFVRRENVIPYIMGANITTFVDTLLAAVLLGNPPAFTVVLISMLSTAAVSILILGLLYNRYLQIMLRYVAWVTASNRNLALFMLGILVVPVILMAL